MSPNDSDQPVTAKSDNAMPHQIAAVMKRSEQ